MQNVSVHYIFSRWTLRGFRYPGASAVAVLFLFAVNSFAQGGPPMITDDTETVPKHHFEINTAFTVEHGSEGTSYEVPLVDFNYGLNKRMQLKVEMPWAYLHNNGQPTINGIGNANIGVRWRFRDATEKHKVAMSIYPAFEFNVSQSSVRRGLADKGPSFLLPLEMQTDIGKFGLNGEVGYRFARGQDEVIYGLVLGREINKRVELMAEFHGEGPSNRIEQHAELYNFGTRIGMTRHTTFLFAAGGNFRQNIDPRFIMYAGVQVTF